MSAVLELEEIYRVTGYKRPLDQLDELQRQGFFRARRSRVDGKVILERSHYDAVCAGAGQPANEPRLRPITRKKA